MMVSRPTNDDEARPAAGPSGGRTMTALGSVLRLARQSRGLLAKVASAVLVIIGIVSLTFLVSHVFTADPVNLFVGNSASTETREKARQELGLADPLPVQYLHFLGGLIQGDLGRSYLTGRPVTADLMTRLPATVEL